MFVINYYDYYYYTFQQRYLSIDAKMKLGTNMKKMVLFPQCPCMTIP